MGVVESEVVVVTAVEDWVEVVVELGPPDGVVVVVDGVVGKLTGVMWCGHRSVI